MTDASPPASPPAPPASAPQPPPQPSVAAKGLWKPARAGWISIGVFTALIVVGVLAVLATWRLPPFTTPIVRTEDAYVGGHTTVISPEVSGYVWRVPVEDFQAVRAGELLVEIDPRTYQQDLARAKSQLASSRTGLANNEQNLTRDDADVSAKAAAIESAQAQVRRAATELARTSDLVRDGSVSPRENEANAAALASAQASLKEAQAVKQAAEADVRSSQVNGGSLQASVDGAKAAVDAAALELGHTVIHAPEDGQLSEVGVKIGQYVTSGTELFFLVPPGRDPHQVLAERLKPGMSVEASVDTST